MLGWIIYGAVLAISLSTNIAILAVWRLMLKEWRQKPHDAVISFLEGAGVSLRNKAIVFDARGNFEIVPVADHADHVHPDHPGEST